jgi:hypothetical protein
MVKTKFQLMTLPEARDIAGNLSKPSKMPGYAYSLPASHCQTGQKLAAVPDSVCAGCYATRGNYLYPNVQGALHRRLKGLQSPDWPLAVASLIYYHCLIIDDQPYFRWHDSGDLQSLHHLEQVVQIAKWLPAVKFWLPTRELQYLAAYVGKHGARWPKNLTIRLSATLIDGPLPTGAAALAGVQVSGVSRVSWNCPAYENTALTGGSNCGACRNCWNRKIPVVIYKKH